MAVTSRSNNAQTPWESSSLTGDLVVNVTVNVVAPAAQGPSADREALFWTSIKDGTDPAVFDAYLKQYPEGTFAVLARRRLASLAAPPPASSSARFDGLWTVTVDCPRTSAGSARCRRLRPSILRRSEGWSALHGQRGNEGHPDSLAFVGRIQPDGTAAINARGMTGDPKFNIDRLTKGTVYTYRATAHFDGSRGTGKRIERRSYDLAFVKQ